MAYNNPTVGEFKAFFSRDFPFGTDPNVAVTDADIVKAFAFTNSCTGGINPALFCDQNSYTLGYELLSAHYLVMNLRASSQGISGQFGFLEQSKSVGSVSQSFAIPQRVLDNPEWSVLFKTNYGAQYMQMILPQMGGQIFIAYGSTRP